MSITLTLAWWMAVPVAWTALFVFLIVHWTLRDDIKAEDFGYALFFWFITAGSSIFTGILAAS